MMAWITVVLALAVCWAAQGAPLRVLCMGDSITKGARSGVTEEQTYEAVLQARLVAAGLEVEVSNAGIGGERTDMAVKRLEGEMKTRAPLLVTIMYATNDAAVDQGHTASRLPLAVYEENLRVMVRMVRQQGATAVLMTPIPLGRKFAYMAWSPYREQGPNWAMLPYVQAVRRVAVEEAAPVVDHFAQWAELALMGKDLDELMLDGCHPNPEGQKVVAEAMLPVVERVLRGR
ncbi:MAG: GDSL-type esterase/lipase family protein [Armatimonadia bacterium]